MSSKLKKKTKDPFKFVESRYRNKDAKDDRIIANIADQIVAVMYMACYDVLGFKAQKMINFYKEIMIVKAQWNDDCICKDSMQEYCEKKNIPIIPHVKKLKMSQKLRMARPEVPSAQNIGEFTKLTEYCHILHLGLAAVVLKEKYKVSNENVEKVFGYMDKVLDAMTTIQPGEKITYLSKQDIIDMLKDEIKLDIVSGVKIK